MATVEQLSKALINADKAGDVQAARTLANEIIRLRGEQTQPQAEPVEQGDGLALNTTAGLNNAIYSTAGFPVDASRWLINKGIQGANYALGSEMQEIPSDSVGGSESISGMFGAIGVPEPKDIRAVTPEERIARGVGEGVGYAVAPEAPVAGMARAGALSPRIAEMSGRLFGNGASVGEVAGNAVTGGASGVGAAAGMEAAPDDMKPVASLLGGLAGGGVGAVAATTPQMARAAGGAALDMAAPLTKTGRMQLAGKQIQESATDPAAVRERLADIPEDLIAGSKPTTFQLTGDLGLGGLERGAQTRRPDLFNQRRADQNNARTTALGEIQREGAPEKVSEMARQFIAGVEERASEAYEKAAALARKKTEAAGTGVAPDVAGGNIRGALEDARATAKDVERQLWNAVDPDGTLTLAADRVRSQLQDIQGKLAKSARPPHGEEAAILGVIGQYEPVMPFSEITALQSRIKTEMRAERLANGESPAYRRLSQLNSAIHGDIEAAITGQIEQEAKAVASGGLRDEDTLASRMKNEVDGWLNAKQARTGSTDDGAGNFSASRGRPLALSGETGAGRPTGGRFTPAQSDQKLSGAPLQPNFDAAAAERLSAAREATASRATVFDNKILSPIRKRPATTAPYDMPAASVPGRIFAPGPQSRESIRALRAAIGDEAALRHVESHAVDRLRKAALREDGTFDPQRLETWRRAHADALREIPGLDAKIKDARHASEFMGAVVRRDKQTVDDLRRSRLGALMNLNDPADVTRVIGGIFQRQDRNEQMMRLASVMSRDPEAKQGLRKAVVDHIMGRLVSNTEAATSGQNVLRADQFQTFVRENAAAMKAAGFSADEIQLIEKISQDIQRANRSLNAARIPGQSNTAQDWQKVREGDAPTTVLGRILMGTAATGGFASGGLPGGAMGVLGAKTVEAMRAFGIETVNDIVADAMLNPGRARLLLSTYKPRNSAQIGSMLARTYRNAALPTIGVATGLPKQGENRK